jgi:ATP-dependent Clp protease adaptor protein ClpS
MSDEYENDTPQFDEGVDVKVKPEVKRPSMYKVILLNDDYTPMDFVVEVLQKFFGINQDHAIEIMLTVHQRGLAVVGIYTYEIAETKVTQVLEYSRHCKQPLQCTMEKE